MDQTYIEFSRLLDKGDKGGCVEYALGKLSRSEIDVPRLYLEILTPALNSIQCTEDNSDTSIWREHVKSAIVRTIIECSYPYILKERDSKYGGKIAKKILVVCPTEEFHEIGAKMVADFFTLCGFDAIFIGANTPGLNIVTAVSDMKPDFIAMSVSNYYNIVAAGKAISKLREAGFESLKVIVGGNAFVKNPDEYKRIGADMVLQTFEDIKRLRGGMK